MTSRVEQDSCTVLLLQMRTMKLVDTFLILGHVVILPLCVMVNTPGFLSSVFCFLLFASLSFCTGD